MNDWVNGKTTIIDENQNMMNVQVIFEFNIEELNKKYIVLENTWKYIWLFLSVFIFCLKGIWKNNLESKKPKK